MPAPEKVKGDASKVTAISYQTEQVGKLIASSKTRHCWSLEVDGEMQFLTLTVSWNSGKYVVDLNGYEQTRHETQGLFTYSFRYRNHYFSISPGSTQNWRLTIDGVGFHELTAEGKAAQDDLFRQFAHRRRASETASEEKDSRPNSEEKSRSAGGGRSRGKGESESDEEKSRSEEKSRRPRKKRDELSAGVLSGGGVLLEDEEPLRIAEAAGNPFLTFADDNGDGSSPRVGQGSGGMISRDVFSGRSGNHKSSHSRKKKSHEPLSGNLAARLGKESTGDGFEPSSDEGDRHEGRQRAEGAFRDDRNSRRADRDANREGKSFDREGKTSDREDRSFDRDDAWGKQAFAPSSIAAERSRAPRVAHGVFSPTDQGRDLDWDDVALSKDAKPESLSRTRAQASTSNVPSGEAVVPDLFLFSDKSQ